MAAPLAGIRVVEVATWLAAPSAAALMADLGADVVKIEPPAGDDFRWYMQHTRPEGAPNHTFELDNRGKRSLVVDLERPRGREVVYRLCQDADVFVTNVVRRRLDRYGLDYESIRAANGRIVYGALSGYGYRGPKANRPGFDGGAFWAESGIMGIMGSEGTPLVQSRGGQGDHPTGINLLAAVLLALRLRDQTGEAQFVDVSLQRTGMWTIASDMVRALNGAPQPPRANVASRGLVTWGAYETGDGRHVMLMMNQPQRFWVRFCRALERDDWAADERYQDIEGLMEHGGELMPEIAAIFRTRTLAEWVERLEACECLFAPVALLEEVAHDPQLDAYGAFVPLARTDGSTSTTVAAPFEIAGAEVAVRGPAPDLGAHTHEVLTEAGFEDAEIASLAEEGIFG